MRIRGPAIPPSGPSFRYDYESSALTREGSGAFPAIRCGIQHGDV